MAERAETEIERNLAGECVTYEIIIGVLTDTLRWADDRIKELEQNTEKDRSEESQTSTA